MKLFPASAPAPSHPPWLNAGLVLRALFPYWVVTKVCQTEKRGQGTGDLAGDLDPSPGRSFVGSQGLKEHLEPLFSPAWIKPVPDKGRASGVPRGPLHLLSCLLSTCC